MIGAYWVGVVRCGFDCECFLPFLATLKRIFAEVVCGVCPLFVCVLYVVRICGSTICL